MFEIMTAPSWASSIFHCDEPLCEFPYIMRANRTYYCVITRPFFRQRDKDGFIAAVVAQPRVRRDVEDAVEPRLETVGRRTGAVQAIILSPIQ
jgi:hypothetical protein